MKVSFAYDPCYAKVVPKGYCKKIIVKSIIYLYDNSLTWSGQIARFCQLTNCFLAKRPIPRLNKKGEGKIAPFNSRG